MHAACSTEVSCVKLMYRLKDARTMLCHQSNVSLTMMFVCTLMHMQTLLHAHAYKCTHTNKTCTYAQTCRLVSPQDILYTSVSMNRSWESH
jgi:hypothetical protein